MKKKYPTIRTDRRFRCAQCEELCHPDDHDGAYLEDKLTGDKLKPVCSSCEQSW